MARDVDFTEYARRMLDTLEGFLVTCGVFQETLEAMRALRSCVPPDVSPWVSSQLDDIDRRLEGCRMFLNRCRRGWPRTHRKYPKEARKWT